VYLFKSIKPLVNLNDHICDSKYIWPSRKQLGPEAELVKAEYIVAGR
jgi:hypothetical protein